MIHSKTASRLATSSERKDALEAQVRSMQHTLNALLARSATGSSAQQEADTDDGVLSRISLLQNEIRAVRRQQDVLNESIPPPMYSARQDDQSRPE